MSALLSRTSLEYVQDNRGSLKLKGDRFEVEPEYRHARFLPSVTPPSALLPPLEPFEHDDPGHRALKLANPRAIFETDGVRSIQITPGIGSEVSDLKLHLLDASGRDQVALEVARRGVIAFRGQEFGEQSFDWLKAWGSVRRLSAAPDRLGSIVLLMLCLRFTSTSAACTSIRRRPPRRASMRRIWFIAKGVLMGPPPRASTRRTGRRCPRSAGTVRQPWSPRIPGVN
jgi:hypothetical protein